MAKYDHGGGCPCGLYKECLDKCLENKMGSMTDKVKHSKRIQSKKKARVRSVIAKELIVSGKYKQRIVRDKRGKKHDLDKMKFIDLVQAIQEE